MKKKIMITLALLCLLLLGPSVVHAETMERLVDDGNLLTSDESEALLEKLDEISTRQNLDVVVVTANSLDGKSATEYADDFYDYNGYGYGENRDVILLLVSMEARDWALSTRGYGITAFTDEGQAYISERFISLLSDGEYAAAFETYADLCDNFITQAREGKPYDVGNMPKKKTGVLPILLAIAGGFGLAFLPMGIMKSSMKSVQRQPAAANYVKDGSQKISDRRDVFLYHTVTRTEIPRDDERSKGGGSSIHMGSSGASHGGSSGKF